MGRGTLNTSGRHAIVNPHRLDVLGIAPIDRLGELTWLGPLSVMIFGLVVGLVVQAASVKQFDRWMLLLTVGTFAGAYPLMYFAQEYISLQPAVLISYGILLTAEALGFFIAVMMLMPKAWATWTIASEAGGKPPPSTVLQEQSEKNSSLPEQSEDSRA